MKKLLKTIVLLAAAAIMILSSAVPAFADYPYHIGMLTVIDGDNVINIPALGIAVEGGAVIASDYTPTGSEFDIEFSTQSGVYTCRVDNNSIIADIANDPALVGMDLPDEGMEAVMEYYSSGKGFTVIDVTLTNLHFEDILTMTVEGFPDDIGALPAFIIDNNGNVIAVVSSQGTAVTSWARKNDSSGGGRNNSTTVMAIALAAAVVLTVVFLMKNRSPQRQTSNGSDRVPDGGGSNGFNDEYYTRPISDAGATMPVMPVTPAQGATTYRLRCAGGQMDGRTYTINGGELTIGRSAEAAIRYPDDAKGVSRNHCKLFMFDGRLMLMDTGSSYGTFLEGKGRLTPNVPQPVNRGDSFCVGDTRNKFIIE